MRSIIRRTRRFISCTCAIVLLCPSETACTSHTRTHNVPHTPLKLPSPEPDLAPHCSSVLGQHAHRVIWHNHL
jgi:hypothetical protein